MYQALGLNITPVIRGNGVSSECWRHERGSRVLEAECVACGTRYLMGNDGGLDEIREFAM